MKAKNCTVTKFYRFEGNVESTFLSHRVNASVPEYACTETTSTAWTHSDDRNLIVLMT